MHYFNPAGAYFVMAARWVLASDRACAVAAALFACVCAAVLMFCCAARRAGSADRKKLAELAAKYAASQRSLEEKKAAANGLAEDLRRSRAEMEALEEHKEALRAEMRALKKQPPAVPGVRAVRCPRVRVVCFANHKGGVGKSTMLSWVARFVAEAEPRKSVLVVDLSVFGDATALLLGRDGATEAGSQGKTVEAFAADALAPGAPVPVSGGLVARFCTRARENLFVMAAAAASEAAEGTSALERISDDDASRVSHALRASLEADAAANGAEWIVLVDTDGGVLMGHTKLALGASDGVVLPLSENPADASRLGVLFRYLRTLRGRGLTLARCWLAVFNAVSSKANKTCTELSPFTPQKATLGAMRGVATLLEGMAEQFPGALGDARTRRRRDFFASVRKGGVAMVAARSTGILGEGASAGNAEPDLRRLAKQVAAACAAARDGGEEEGDGAGFGRVQQKLELL